MNKKKHETSNHVDRAYEQGRSDERTAMMVYLEETGDRLTEAYRRGQQRERDAILVLLEGMWKERNDLASSWTGDFTDQRNQADGIEAALNAIERGDHLRGDDE